MKKMILILLFLNLDLFSMENEKEPDVIGFSKILDEVIRSNGTILPYNFAILEACESFKDPNYIIKNPVAKLHLEKVFLLNGNKISDKARAKIQYNPAIKPGDWKAWKLDLHLDDFIEDIIKEKKTKKDS